MFRFQDALTIAAKHTRLGGIASKQLLKESVLNFSRRLILLSLSTQETSPRHVRILCLQGVAIRRFYSSRCCLSRFSSNSTCNVLVTIITIIIITVTNIIARTFTDRCCKRTALPQFHPDALTAYFRKAFNEYFCSAGSLCCTSPSAQLVPKPFTPLHSAPRKAIACLDRFL